MVPLVAAGLMVRSFPIYGSVQTAQSKRRSKSSKVALPEPDGKMAQSGLRTRRRRFITGFKIRSPYCRA
jgi:hypothetical protein